MDSSSPERPAAKRCLALGSWPFADGDDVPRGCAEEPGLGGDSPRNLQDAETRLAQELADLVQAVGAHRYLLLALAAVAEHHRPADQHAAGMVVEVHLFENHAAITLPPHPAGQIADDVVAVD